MIAVDAMGGDYAPHAIVQGAYAAARQGVPVRLFGDAYQIESILKSTDSLWTQLPISIEHCSEVISMEEMPTKAVLQKKDSSLIRAITSVANKQSQGIVSAGHSGATLVASTLLIGRVSGVLRPAIAAFLPTKKGSVLCLDLGANTDCKPEYLEQFAVIGAAYSSMIKKIKQPRIALLSNGREPYKGSQLVKEAYKRLESSTLHFIGNVESLAVFEGVADVVVCDGFSGNIMLKAMEGAAQAFLNWLKQEAQASVISRISLGLCKPILKRLRKKMDYEETGGALLLGVNSPVVVAHGCSQAHAIERAILFAYNIVQEHCVETLNQSITHMLVSTKSLDKNTHIAHMVVEEYQQ